MVIFFPGTRFGNMRPSMVDGVGTTKLSHCHAQSSDRGTKGPSQKQKYKRMCPRLLCLNVHQMLKPDIPDSEPGFGKNVAFVL